MMHSGTEWLTNRAPAPSIAPMPTATTPAPETNKRVLLKLSGEAFCQPGGFGVDPHELEVIASEVRDGAKAGARLAVVVGGGNIIRGAQLAEAGHIHRATADYMGMLGTVINALALKEKLLTLGVDSRVMSAIEIRAVAEPFIRGRALRHMDKGRVVILAAGTGNPFFSTDTCAALRATELECGILLKATKVDGVYTADPKKDPKATRYERLTFKEAIEKNLKVMDMTALTMCQENGIPVLVFDFKQKGNIRKVIEGGDIGTRIDNRV
jgi:uridylate kinase